MKLNRWLKAILILIAVFMGLEGLARYFLTDVNMHIPPKKAQQIRFLGVVKTFCYDSCLSLPNTKEELLNLKCSDTCQDKASCEQELREIRKVTTTDYWDHSVSIEESSEGLILVSHGDEGTRNKSGKVEEIRIHLDCHKGLDDTVE